jgi:hypothetical protein
MRVMPSKHATLMEKSTVEEDSESTLQAASPKEDEHSLK